LKKQTRDGSIWPNNWQYTIDNDVFCTIPGLQRTASRCAAPGKSTQGIALTNRLRIDRLLVERGLFESRAKAQAAIDAGLVTANGVPVRKPSEEIAVDARLQASAAHPYVSRGGVKLAAALDHFGFDPTGRVCLDVGASTGGFTQVLLDRGAKSVTAVDVGHGQLHDSLRARPGLVSLERTDIRALSPAQLGEPPDLVTVDVSFISLKLVLPAALALTKTPAQLVALIKPQFEAGRGAVRKGVIRDTAVQAAVGGDIAAVVASLGWQVLGVIPSPIAGGDGNAEFLLGAVKR
jgi:23S rRNA (cytidine1920-2'-O)/16S rRNA (cytidine1409-2'-O)-methyltransferase